MITRLCMPFPNVTMLCRLLFWFVTIVLFHFIASSTAQHASANNSVPPPTHAVTSPGLNAISRDNISFIITICTDLPPLYSHPTKPLSVHYALNILYRAQQSAPFTLCSERTRRLVLLAFSRTLILLLLCSSGDVEVNPGPAVSTSTPIPQALSFVDFCNRKSLGFMHVNIRSLLPKFVFFNALAHSTNPDFLAVSEFPFLTIPFSNKIALPTGAVLQFTAKITCRVLSYYPGLYPNNLSFYF